MQWISTGDATHGLPTRIWIPGYNAKTKLLESQITPNFSTAGFEEISMQISMRRHNLARENALTKSSLRNGSGSQLFIFFKAPNAKALTQLASVPIFFFSRAAPVSFQPQFIDGPAARADPSAAKPKEADFYYITLVADVPGATHAFQFDWTLLTPLTVDSTNSKSHLLKLTTRIISFSATINNVGGKLLRPIQVTFKLFKRGQTLPLVSGKAETIFNIHTQKSQGGDMTKDEVELIAPKNKEKNGLSAIDEPHATPLQVHGAKVAPPKSPAHFKPIKSE